MRKSESPLEPLFTPSGPPLDPFYTPSRPPLDPHLLRLVAIGEQLLDPLPQILRAEPRHRRLLAHLRGPNGPSS